MKKLAEVRKLNKCCDFGEYKCYEYLKIPKHMEEYKNNRMKNGLSDVIGIDKCILEEIKYLWNNGVITYNSCCGHGKLRPSVCVSDDSIQTMLNLGYKQCDKGFEFELSKVGFNYNK